jgi:hypothetical protein
VSYVKILHIESQVSDPVERIMRRVVVYWNWRGPYVDAFVGEAWRDSGALFFGFTQQDRELLHSGHGNHYVRLQRHMRYPTSSPCPSGRGRTPPTPFWREERIRFKTRYQRHYRTIMCRAKVAVVMLRFPVLAAIAMLPMLTFAAICQGGLADLG